MLIKHVWLIITKNPGEGMAPQHEYMQKKQKKNMDIPVHIK